VEPAQEDALPAVVAAVPADPPEAALVFRSSHKRYQFHLSRFRNFYNT
jgi:hypothetical protein